jgi:prepilin-type N-terminal cleavage/methylation domain-containing protein
MRRFRKGFTLFEMQMVIVVVAVGIVAVSSVMATERRLLKRLHASSRPSAAQVQLQR